MLSVKEIHTARCDACGISYGTSKGSREDMKLELEMHEWWISPREGGVVFCCNCLKVHRAITDFICDLSVNPRPPAAG